MVFQLAGKSLQNLFRRPVTRLYPKAPYVPAAGTRGRIEIEYEKCNFCTLCDKRCPTGAIKVDRPAKVWEIDRLRCIICGYCVEVCPKDCLHMNALYAAPIGGGLKPTAVEVHAPAANAAATGAPTTGPSTASPTAIGTASAQSVGGSPAVDASQGAGRSETEGKE